MRIIYFDALQESNHTFLSLPESYADDKFYLTEDDVEVIPKVIIAFEYENCRPFSEGLALVQAFDRTKEAFGLVTSYPMVIDKRGKKVFTPEKYYGLDEYSHGLAAVEVPLAGLNEHRWGYMDMAGEMVIQPIYDFAYPFSEGLAAVGVYKSDKARKDKDTTQTDWSFIDEKGHVVLNLDDDYFIEPRPEEERVS